jgi:hypothetical protein
MVNFLEIIDRSLEGPFTFENDFDLNIFVPKLREVIKKNMRLSMTLKILCLVMTIWQIGFSKQE